MDMHKLLILQVIVKGMDMIRTSAIPGINYAIKYNGSHIVTYKCIKTLRTQDFSGVMTPIGMII